MTITVKIKNFPDDFIITYEEFSFAIGQDMDNFSGILGNGDSILEENDVIEMVVRHYCSLEDAIEEITDNSLFTFNNKSFTVEVIK